MSTGGSGSGGGHVVGGIEVVASLDTTQIDPGLAALQAKSAELGARLEKLGSQAATATTKVDAGMKMAGRGAAGFANQLQVVGQTLDDFQYVGEMGLRPILNNLMQISPVLGIVALGFDQARKSGNDFAKSVENVAAAFLEVAGIALPGGDSMFEGWTKGIDNYVNYIKKVIPEAWGELSGSTQRGMEQAAEAFLKAPKKSDKERGAGIAEAISEYGADRFFKEMIDPALMAGNNPEALATEQKALIDLIGKAKKGDRAAADTLIARSTGTGVGAQIWAALPETKAEKKAEEEAEKEAEKKARIREKEEAKSFRDLEAESRANAGLYDFKQKTIREKIEKGKALSEDELSVASPENRERMRDREIRLGDERARLAERGGDLNYRLRQLINPARQGQSLGLDAYESSIKSQTGESPEAKRLHAIQEILKDIRKNNENIKLIGVKKR